MSELTCAYALQALPTGEVTEIQEHLDKLRETMNQVREGAGDALTLVALHKAQILKLKAQLKVLSGPGHS